MNAPTVLAVTVVGSLVLMGGLLAVLAIGAGGAFPGATAPSLSPSLAGTTSSCTVHTNLAFNPTVPKAGVPFVVDAGASESGRCALHVTQFVFQGLPQYAGPVASATGILSLTAMHPGSYPVTVTVTTDLEPGRRTLSPSLCPPAGDRAPSRGPPPYSPLVDEPLNRAHG